MKKLLFTLLIISALFSNAQFRASLGAEVAIPFEDGVNFGLGLNVGGEYLLNDNMGLTGNIGVTHFFTDIDDFSLNAIPIMFGYRYYLDSYDSGLFFSGQLGFNIMTWKYKILDQTSKDSDTKFGFGIGGGYRINENIEVGLRYNMVMYDLDNFNYLSIGGAYSF